MRWARRTLAIGFTLGVTVVPTAHASHPAVAELAPTPPMGWSSWYRFYCATDEALIKRTAYAIATNGMEALGYRYVNIDDCWMTHKRTRSGSLQPDPKKFPDGISGVASYVHSLGLKLGIYLDAGPFTCTGFPGSAGHFRQDASMIA
jgi:alpha-galactosidase